MSANVRRIATNCKSPAILNFNLDKVGFPVVRVSESILIIELPFSEVKLAGSQGRYVYRLRPFSVLIPFRTYESQTL
jgi:hypothetical protein